MNKINYLQDRCGSSKPISFNLLEKFKLLWLGTMAAIVVALSGSQSASAQSANAVTMINGYNSAFLYNSGGTAYYKNAINKTTMESGWGLALDIEGQEDAYEVSGSAANQTLVNNLCTTFLVNNPTNGWSGDPWNDDIGWMSLMLARGYQMTGNTLFLNAAEYGFNMAFARGWDTSNLGGGILEKQGDPGKNPLACDSLGKAAIIIYQTTGNTTYYNESKQIYDWVWNHLFVPSTGLVCGSINPDGTVNTDPHIYNQGTFADYANLLYESGAGSTYLGDAENAMNYAINHLTTGGILSETDQSPQADDAARALGHMCGFTPSLWSTYYSFMANNANSIWSHRRTDYNITWNEWNQQTPVDNTQIPFMMVSAVAWMQFTPATQPLTSISGIHSIINKFSRLALDDPGSATGNGTNMVQWGYNGGSNQKWTFTQNSDGTYTIINQASGKALDDPGFATANGTKVDQWTSNGGTNQHWTVTPNQDGTYTIINKTSGLALEDPNFSTSNGTLMDQWGNNNGPNQRWLIQ